MSGPYFQPSGWPVFIYRGASYNLSHLNEYVMCVVDAAKQSRNIVVTFTDHCFTREPEPGDDPLLAFPGCSRGKGHFCFRRYGLSLKIRKHIDYAVGGKVWATSRENYAAVPTEDMDGHTILYGIIFSLDPATGFAGIHLHMRVRSAYPVDDTLATFGNVQFSNLVRLRMANKHPKKITGRNRQVPRLSR
jgi:hypothetical protein